MPRKESPLGCPDGVQGVAVRFAAELRRLRDLSGRPTYRELSRRAHYSPAALSDAAAGRRLPTLAVALAYVRACGGDEAEWKERWHTAAAELAAAEEAAPSDGAAGAAPYVGLGPFQSGDAGRFYGRDALVRDLRERLRERRLVGVFGASGAGKSSVLRAGLVAEAAAAGQPVLVFTPGAYPVEECAVQLAVLTGEPAARLRAELAAGPRALHLRIRQLMAEAGPGTDLLVVVDQFEELFTVCREEAERDWLIDALVLAADGGAGRARVVIAVRSDFQGHCERHPRLAEALRDGRVVVGPMSPDELREAVVAPAVGSGCTVESALVSRLVADAAGQSAALPLVSHALLETWKRRRGTTLTLAGYEAAGGIRHAIARTAETAYLALTADRRAVARQIFLRLTALGEGTEDTRRRVTRRELGDGPGVSAVLEELASARLVTLDRDGVELAHEALIRSWPRLQTWLTRDREGLRVHRRLAEATDTWESLGRDEGALYRGLRLSMATEWAADPDNDAVLTGREREFLDAGRAARSREEAAERRRIRRLRQLVALLAVLALVASAATTFALRARAATDRQRDIAVARKVVAEAAALRAADPALAAQLSLAAYRLAPVPEARDSVLSTLGAPYASRLTGHTDTVRATAFRRDGRLLATAGDDRTVRLWRTDDPDHPFRVAVLTRHTGAVHALAFSPRGQVLATAGDDNTVRLWSVADPARPVRLAVLRGHTDFVYAVGFSPDARTLVSGGIDTTARLWDIADPRRPRSLAVLTAHSERVNAAAFTPDGRTLVTGSGDGTARLWDVTDRRRPRVRARLAPGLRSRIEAVAVSPGGRLLATAGWDDAVRLWDLTDPSRPRSVAVLTGHTDTVRSVAFSPDGRTLASGSSDQTVRLWDVTDPRRPGGRTPLTGHTNAVLSVAFASGGNVLATASGRAVRLTQLGRFPLSAHQGRVRTASFSPDGRLLATAGEDGTVGLWDPADPRRVHRPAAFAAHTQPVTTAVFAPGGRALATAGEDFRVRLWRLGADGRIEPRGVIGKWVASVAYRPDGRVLATGGEDYRARLWDVRDDRHPRQLANLGVQGSMVASVAFSPDGRLLASGGDDHTVRLWHVSEAGRPMRLAVLRRPAASFTSVCFSPDGRLLAAGSTDGAVRLWDLTDPSRPRSVAVLTGHTDTVRSVAFGPDGRTLASGSTDNTVRLWDVSRPARAATTAVLSGHTNAVTSVAFSPDGRTLSSSGDDHTVRLWATDVDRAAARICALTASSITVAEWRRYFPGQGYRPPCR